MVTSVDGQWTDTRIRAPFGRKTWRKETA